MQLCRPTIKSNDRNNGDCYRLLKADSNEHFLYRNSGEKIEPRLKVMFENIDWCKVNVNVMFIVT